MIIRTGGLRVFARLDVDERDRTEAGHVTSGNDRLDELFGGGLDVGSTCLVMGTSGAGKSTLAAIYAAAVADRGGFASIYCFDESRQTFLHRARGLKLGITRHAGDGLVDLRQYKVGDLTPGQFFDDLRDDVEQRHAKLVVIDSYTGYLNLMPEEGQLITKLHELLRYLSSRGVLTLMTVNLHGLFGRGSDVPTSYLADTIVLMRHFEAMGRIRRCISVLKKRHGNHEQSIREVQVGEGGLQVGPPLEKFSGLLSGTPTYHGQHQSLLENDGDPDAEQA